MGFKEQLGAFRVKTEAKASQVVRAIALEALKGVVLKTPVDTGRARGNWRVGLNTPDKTADLYTAGGGDLDERADEAAAHAISRAQPLIRSFKLGDNIHITNNLDYILLLERGWSKKAPNGMMRITYARILRYVRIAVAKANAT